MGLPLDEAVFHATRFTKNRARLLTTAVAEAIFSAIREQAEAHELLSREHFSVDGTLLEAAAALKSLRPLEEDAGEEPPAAAGRNQSVDFHGQRRGNETNRSRTDPEARLARKGNGREARLCYAGHPSPRTATASSSRSSSRRPPAPPSARLACVCWLASAAAVLGA